MISMLRVHATLSLFLTHSLSLSFSLCPVNTRILVIYLYPPWVNRVRIASSQISIAIDVCGLFTGSERDKERDKEKEREKERKRERESEKDGQIKREMFRIVI
jgi:hypothetical protein